MKKKTNKALSVLLSVLMLVSVFTIALPETISVQAETTGADFTYSLDGENAVITAYTGTETEVTVPDTIDEHKVTGIDEFAFFMNYSITDVTIPESVTSIGDYAFFHCVKLGNVTFKGNTLTEIGTSAFEGCTNLQEITLPDVTSSVGERAFLNCDNLLTVTAGTTLDNVGAYAFGYLRETSDWSYVINYVTLRGYSSTALETYGYDNGLIFVGLGEGTAAPAKNTQTPEEDLDIPVIEFTDYNNYTDDDDSTLNIRDVIKENTKSYTANAAATYTDPETGLSFEVYANLKLQGNSSMSYPKKNFTIKLYKDETFGSKYKVELQDGWGKESKYVLKANYMDHSHSRNVLGAKLWGQIVNSRETTYQQLLDSPNGGAIDGYPVKVYINGEYEGLYTLNIPKDDWQFAMGDGTQEALLAGESHEGSCNFTQSGRYDESDWTIEYPEEDVTWVINSFNEVIAFVSNSTDEEFKNMFSDYLDYDSCIDYYVYMLYICGTDNWEKNMLMATYDGQQWFPSVYDMDSTFGIYWNGGHYNSVNWMLTHEYMGPDNGTQSLLWQRVYENFYDDIVARYAELRDTVLSEKNFIKTLNDFIGDIPKEVFDRDLYKYGGIPSSSSSDPNQIINYTLERLTYLDEQFGYDSEQPEQPDEPEQPSKDSLKEKIDEANLIDTAEYTAVSSAYFKQELAYASEIYNSADSSSDEIQAAEASLAKAISLLISAGDENCLDLAEIPQSSLTAEAANSHSGEDGSKAIDGNPSTMWHTYWNASEGTMPVISEDGVDNYITITVNDDSVTNIAGISYQARTDNSNNGDIVRYKIMYSTEADGENFIEVSGGSGTWQENKDEKFCIFTAPVAAKRIRIYATETLGAQANAYISAAEINLLTTDTSSLKAETETASALEAKDYTEESYGEMKNQLDKALNVLSVPETYQNEINTALTSLKTAVANLVEAEDTTPDKTALLTLIGEAKAIDTSVYTVTSREALAQVISEAEKISDDENAVQTDIDNACTVLKLAIEGLSYYMGDINHDGAITINDATYIQLYVSGYEIDEFDKELADTDSDTIITINDATIIQKLLVRIITNNDDGSINL